MSDKNIAQYLTLQQSFGQELIEIEKQIEELISRQEELKAVLEWQYPAAGKDEPKLTKTPTEPDDEWLFVSYLKKRPGANRSDIRAWSEGNITDKDMSSIMSKLSKRGVIENRGTKRESAWYVV